MIGAELPILFMTPEQFDMEELGLEINEGECDVRQMTFYRIDAIAPRKGHEGKQTIIYAGGTSFACDLTVPEVKIIIEKSICKLETPLTSHP